MATTPVDPTSWPAIAALVLGSTVVGSLLTKVMDRTGARGESVRAGYADATRALNAWGQYPFRIRRRTDDDVETLRRLEALGAEIQEAVAYSSGWVAAENAAMGELFNELVTALRAEVAVHARAAWAAPAASTPGGMNLGGPTSRVDIPATDSEAGRWAGAMPAEWFVVQVFAGAVRYRSGWKRYLLPSKYLHWRFDRDQLVAKVRAELRRRPARVLSSADPQSPSSATP